MPFDCRVVFSGLCAYVPDRPLGDNNEPPGLMRVVMVDARQEKEAFGSTPENPIMMKPHFPVIVVNAADLRDSGDLHLPTKCAWFVGRKELTLEIPDSEQAHNALDVVQGPLEPNEPKPLPALNEDFRWGADMETIAPEMSQMHPRAFEDAGSQGLVSARVLLDKGRLSTYQLGGPPWSISDALGGSWTPRLVSNKAALDLSEVSRLTLVARDMNGGATERLDLRPADGQLLEIHIGNRCNERLMPKHLATHDVVVTADEDFRWFYELARTPPSRSAGVLPVPEVVEPPFRGNGAVQCMRATFAAMP